MAFSVRERFFPEIALTLQPLLVWKKARETSEKNQGFSDRETPKIRGKGRKNAQKKH